MEGRIGPFKIYIKIAKMCYDSSKGDELIQVNRF